MSSDPQRFFSAPQGAACLKHATLRRYLAVFAGKTGSTAGRVCYVDGFAGKGEYDDGTPGSPLHAASLSRYLQRLTRQIDLVGYLVERDETLVEALRDLITPLRPEWVVSHGQLQNEIPTILDWAQHDPTFWFIDPFGLGLSFRSVVDQLMGRPGKTEALLNLSCGAILRCASRLNEQPADGTIARARLSTLRRLDQAAGGVWWRTLWDDHDRAGSVSAVVGGIVDRYTAEGFHTYALPVADRFDASPDYYLVLITRYQPALWLFNEHVSLAKQECREEIGITGRQPELPIFGRGLIEPDDETAWELEIAGNIARLLSGGGSHRLLDEMTTVFGRTLGYARTTHVRHALNRLASDDRVDFDQAGNLYDCVVQAGPAL